MIQALEKWTPHYLLNQFENNGTSYLNVNITPDGRADSVKEIKSVGKRRQSKPGHDEDSMEDHIVDVDNNKPESQDVFVEPLEIKMSPKLFFEMLLSPRNGDVVPYLSSQNYNYSM